MNTRPWWIVPCACVWLAGCFGSAKTTDFDSDHAKETLVAALDAWKQGQAQSLAQRTPPIRFVDDDWRDGCQLTDYRRDQADSRIQPFQGVKVVLVLKDRLGKTIEKTAIYQVGLSPTLTVLRSDP